MGIVVIVIIVVVIAGIIIALFGWDRYRGNRKKPADTDALQATDEVFVDPDTGGRTRVWYDPRSGRREYRAER
jgi:hypothetical protein